MEAHRTLGANLSLVEGVGSKTILTLLSEIARSLDAFENAGKLASHLGLRPGRDISGGETLSGKTKNCRVACRWP